MTALIIVGVGVAMEEGAVLAMDIGDVILMDNNLKKRVFCMRG